LKLIPVALVIFHRKKSENILEVWTQTRDDDGIYHGLQEFPGGGIESDETPLQAAVREVSEEVGIEISVQDGKLMGIYSINLEHRTILLNVFLFPDYPDLKDKGRWLTINQQDLSSPFFGQIPGPNHQMIDDLYRSLYS
jgi:8-oxo-dGTP pyrophosphatase MutT (NUDIX family)